MKPSTDRQNITLSLPKSLLRRVKILAVKRGSSISQLLARALDDLVSREDAYERARRRSLRRLEEPPDLGTGGRRSWSRDELHERG